MKSDYIITLSGPTGSGKSTLQDFLTDTGNFRRAVSFTTRKPRPGEVDGVDYHFITEDIYQEYVNQNRVAQYTHFNGITYGTTFDEYQIKEIPTVVVVPESVPQIEEVAALVNKKVLKIFVSAPLEIMVERLVNRKDPSDYAAKRLISLINVEDATWQQKFEWDMEVVLFMPGDETWVIEEIVERVAKPVSRARKFFGWWKGKF